VRAYPRETQKMVFDAHARAFAFFGGVPTRGIYDNMKTAVATMFTGKERVFNRRFLIMADHYMVEPVACSPAAGGGGALVLYLGGSISMMFAVLAAALFMYALIVFFAVRFGDSLDALVLPKP
jgi:transposase